MQTNGNRICTTASQQIHSTMTDEAQQKHEAAVMLGRLGGRAGRGESKRRPLSAQRARAMAAAKQLKKAKNENK